MHELGVGKQYLFQYVPDMFLIDITIGCKMLKSSS